MKYEFIKWVNWYEPELNHLYEIFQNYIPKKSSYDTSYVTYDKFCHFIYKVSSKEIY